MPQAREMSSSHARPATVCALAAPIDFRAAVRVAGLVADGVHKLFQKFQKETSGEAETKNKSAMKELSDLMKAMPQNKDKKEKLSLHISLADRV